MLITSFHGDDISVNKEVNINHNLELVLAAATYMPKHLIYTQCNNNL